MKWTKSIADRCIDCPFADRDVFGFTGTCNIASDQLKPIDFHGEDRPDFCPLVGEYSKQVESEDDDAP